MAHHDRHALLEIGRKLDEARKDPKNRCPTLREDAKGRTHFHVEKPKARRVPRVTQAYGPHGVGYLVIDPATLEVSCGAKGCPNNRSGATLDATAIPPPESIEAKADAIEAENAARAKVS
jgi:hypothetical protein